MDTKSSYVVKPNRAVKYDGTNSAKIAEMIPDFTVTSETATELTFTSGNTTHVLARNGWIVWADGAVTEIFQNDDDYGDAWVGVSPLDHVHDLTLTSGPGKPAPTY